MKKWDFHYVENLSWIRQRVNNSFLEEDAEFCLKSKSSLLIFKKVRNAFLRHNFPVPKTKSESATDRAIWIACSWDINVIRTLFTTLYCRARSIWRTISPYKSMILLKRCCRMPFTKTKRTLENCLKCMLSLIRCGYYTVANKIALVGPSKERREPDGPLSYKRWSNKRLLLTKYYTVRLLRT